jgi:hypothetical protein
MAFDVTGASRGAASEGRGRPDVAAPLTAPELAQALREAAMVAHGDRRHDLLTVLNVLASDHRPDLRELPTLWQITDAVRAVSLSPGAPYAGSANAAQRWCWQHGKSLADLLLEAAVRIEGGATGREGAG